MKLVIVGTGYVGLVSGACFAEFGYKTICVDKDKDRIEKLNSGKCPFYEPGMDDLLSKHLKNTKLLTFSSSLKESMIDADIVFITVGTPSRRLEDEADLSFVWTVADEISQNINSYCVVVTKSTVPVGTSKEIKKIINKKIAKDKFDIVSNPEFLREGSAINDFMRPDRVVIGTDCNKSEEIMRELYRPLFLRETPIVSTTIETSEIIKYASNSFLATKIGFINEIADLCEVVGADVQDVSKAMGIDNRIGSKFLNAGPGYGGSCFPKDVIAFSSTAKRNGVDLSILKSVHNSNNNRIKKIGDKIINKINGGSLICFLGLSFKPNTDDIRESVSIKLIKKLAPKVKSLTLYDSLAIPNAKEALRGIPNINFSKQKYSNFHKINGLIICTEDKEFINPRISELKKLKDEVIFDGRNILERETLEKNNIHYEGVGV